MNYAIAVDGGRHLPVMIALILNNTRHVKTTTAGLSNGDGLRCPLVGVDTAEEQQVAAAFRIEREVLKPDAVMDRGGIGQGRVSIRLADGDIGDAICIGLKHRQNTIRQKPMKGCHPRRFNQSRDTESHETRLLMDTVKLDLPFEHMDHS